MCWRIRDLVDELHKQTARWLVDHYDVILLPTFEAQEMVLRGKHCLRRKSVRRLLTFAHYRFKQFLKHKAFEAGKLVLDVNEAYTSKTVSWTGEIVKNLVVRKSSLVELMVKRWIEISMAPGVFFFGLWC